LIVINPGYGMMTPYMFYSKPPSLGVQRVLDNSVESYYGWGNMKRRIALDLANSALSSSSSSDENRAGNAVGMALVSYLGLTVGEKVAKWYQRRLQNFTNNHPRFEEFRNAHPILGNIVAWLPGAGLVIGGGGGAVAFGYKLWNTPQVKQFCKNPLFQRVALIAIPLGVIVTSFWAILAKNGLKSVSESGKAYRDTRKEYPELSPKQLKQLVTATRNQQYIQAYEENRQASRQADLDPFYGVAPYPIRGAAERFSPVVPRRVRAAEPILN
jgi:hypothetical protein